MDPVQKQPRQCLSRVHNVAEALTFVDCPIMQDQEDLATEKLFSAESGSDYVPWADRGIEAWSRNANIVASLFHDATLHQF
jgi:hypothetical protein